MAFMMQRHNMPSISIYHEPLRGQKRWKNQAMTRFFCVSAIMAFAIFHMATPALAEDAIDKLIYSEIEKQHIPGISVLVARSGKILRAQGYGLSNIELQVPVKPETIFQSGSVGKQF